MTEFVVGYVPRKKSQSIVYLFNGIFVLGTFTGLTRDENPGQCFRRKVAFGRCVGCCFMATVTCGCLTSPSTVTDRCALRSRALKRFKIFGVFSLVD